MCGAVRTLATCTFILKSNPIDNHSNISSKKLQKQNFKPLGHYTFMQWYLPFTKNPRKYTVTYNFSNLQEVYSGNHQIHTKCQLQYLHPPHISTSGKCHCNNSSHKSYWIHRVYVKVSAQVTTVTYMHQSQPSLYSLRKHLTAPRTLTWQSLDLVQCHL